MTPKEKAKDLVNIYTMVIYPILNIQKSKQCALIAVDEILKAIRKDSDFTITYEKAKEYYQQVKKEIEAL